jgi:hypothetical protein
MYTTDYERIKAELDDSETSYTVEDDDGVYWLRSYNTHVASYEKARDILYLKYAWNASSTTLRHVKEFARQMTGAKLNKNELQYIFDNQEVEG